jgi:hypothetical protein
VLGKEIKMRMMMRKELPSFGAEPLPEVVEIVGPWFSRRFTLGVYITSLTTTGECSTVPLRLRKRAAKYLNKEMLMAKSNLCNPPV